MNRSILIFGTGSVAESLQGKLAEDVLVKAFINSSPLTNEFHGIPVILPEDIHNYNYDYIIVASGYFEDIEKLLLQNHIPQDKIVGYIFDDAITYQNINVEIESYLNDKMRRNVMKTLVNDNLIIPELYAATFWKNSGFISIYKDFVREQILALIAQEIHRKQLDGSIAELGVFRGDYTIKIREALPDRELYLFDTFEGFVEKDVNSDNTINNKIYELQKFKNTSESYVISRIKNIGNGRIVTKKGYFPDTFDLYDDTFVFVSVDLNMKQPVKKSLELFYPRLIEGGYILISDYNAPFYDGTRQAVIEYCDKNNITIIPIPDLYGSVLIMK